MTRDRSKEWDAGDEVRLLIAETPELNDLFYKLGYSARLDIDTAKIIGQLKSLLRLDITDFSVFQREVDRMQREIDKVGRGDVPIPATIADPGARQLWMDIAHPLHDVIDGGKWKARCWEAAIAASKHKKKLDEVLRLITEAFEDEWRGYMISAKDRVPFRDLSFAKWNVVNPQQFSQLLNDLGSKLESAQKVLGNDTYRELLEHTAQVKRCIGKADVDVWYHLVSLTRARDSAIWRGQDSSNGAKVKELDGVLWDLVYMRHEHDPFKTQDDARYFRESVLEQAQKYLAHDWMHTPWLTNRLVAGLLDSVIGALAVEMRAGDSSRITAGLPWPWGVLVPKLLSFLFFAGSVVGIRLAFGVGLDWVGWAASGYLAWHYFWRFRRNYLLSKMRGELGAWASRLEWIRDEVKRGQYDAIEISTRLRKPEGKGFVIPSLIFPLLRLAESHGCKKAAGANL